MATGQVVAATLAVFTLGFSSILTGVNFVATVHMLRPKGMTWLRLPLFLWAVYSTALIQILATPVLAITLLLLCFERAVGIGVFDPALGGDPVLFQHFFWFYSHPAVYIMILPAFGMISEIIPVFSRKPIFGYGFVAASTVAIAALSLGVWAHHMFAVGLGHLFDLFFAAASLVIAVPTGVKIFNWLATMWGGAIRFTTAMLFATAFLIEFVIGGLSGVTFAIAPIDGRSS